MRTQQKLKTRGILMLASFFVLLGVIFMPIFPGKMNGLQYLDNLFNMISKGSVYYIPALQKKAEPFNNTTLEASFPVAAERVAGTTLLFEKSGAEVTFADGTMTIKGDMGAILASSMEDADSMFHNNGKPIMEKYGYNEREAMFNWWKAYGGIITDLNKEEKFKEAVLIDSVRKKVLEPSYNYYGVEAGNYKDYFMLIVAALAFYVFYTLWYGFGIMYLFEGLGLRISH